MKLNHKFALIFCLFALFVSGTTAYCFYHTTRRQVMEDIRRRLYDIVAIAATDVDVKAHSTLTGPFRENSGEFSAVRKKLQQIRDAATDIKYIYTLRRGPGGGIIFVVDAESNPEDMAHLGAPYDDASPLLKANFETLAAPMVESSFYTDQWGTWLSGYAPFFNADGTRAGVLGADISAAKVKAYERRLLIMSCALFLFILPLITLAGFLLGRRMARPILEIKRGAEQIGGGDLEKRIQVNRADEIGALAASFNEMAGKLEQSHRHLNALMEKYRGMFENALEGIFQTTPDGRFVAANPSLARILGYDSVRELMSKVNHIQTQLYFDSRDRKKMMALLEKNKRVLNFETRMKRRDGSAIWVEMNAQKLPDSGKETIIEGMLHDITAKKVKETAEREKQEARAASRAKSQFLANMSHEIRTPLNAVMGLADLLGRTELTPKQMDYIGKINASGRNLMALINDILDLSKIEAGRLELEQTEFSLHEVMADISEMFAHRAHNQKIEFLVSIHEKVPSALIGDPFRLGQVLINLTGNAFKFTETGEILVSVQPSSHPAEQQKDKVRLEFSVTDTGSGISADRLGKIFDSFTQADDSITRKHGGTGLGLTISRKITNMMGGEIHAQSEPGKGSRFSFDAVFHLQAAEKQTDLTLPKELRGLKVLIVDDNQTSLEILSNYITGFQMEVITAETGARAIEEVQKAEKPFDLILMDWRMPGLNGIETARRIKHGLTPQKLPIICMVSAYGREDLMHASEKALLDAFLHKPVNPSLLFDTIMELFIRENRPDFGQNPVSPDPPDGHSALAGARILLVEDNEINREIAREWLQFAQLIVTEAANGREAFEKMKSRPFDAVLMDVQMPVLDGLEATRMARREKDLARLPIIAMTAHALKGDREKCLDAGMNDYLTKPLDPKMFMSTLKRWINPGKIRTRVSIPGDSPPPTDKCAMELPGLNTEEGLYRANNKIDLYLKILKSFARDFTGANHRIADLFNNGDTESARRLAHSIKGVAANIGASRLGGLAEMVENSLADGLLETHFKWWRDFETELALVISGIQNTAPETAKADALQKPEDVDEQDVVSRLKNLSTVLDEDLEKAQNLLDELKPSLSSLAGNEAGALSDAMDEFDMDGAARILKHLIRRYEKR